MVGVRTVSVAQPDGTTGGFDRLPGVVAVARQGGRVVFTTTDSDATVLALATAGLLRDLEVVGAGLEEAFLTLTSSKPTSSKPTSSKPANSQLANAGPADGELSGQDRDVAATYTMVSMAGYGAIGALLNYASGVVVDRSIGWMRQLRLTPLSPVRVVVGKGLAAMVTAVVPVVALCVAAVVVNGVRLDAGRWLAIVPLLWLGALPFALLGLGMGYLATAQTVQPLNLLVYLGMSIVGGLWLPLDALPGWVAAVGRWLPTHAYADMSWQVAFGGSPTVTDVLTLAGWMVAFTGLAVFGFRRSVRSTASL